MNNYRVLSAEKKAMLVVITMLIIALLTVACQFEIVDPCERKTDIINAHYDAQIEQLWKDNPGKLSPGRNKEVQIEISRLDSIRAAKIEKACKTHAILKKPYYE